MPSPLRCTNLRQPMEVDEDRTFVPSAHDAIASLQEAHGFAHTVPSLGVVFLTPHLLDLYAVMSRAGTCVCCYL